MVGKTFLNLKAVEHKMCSLFELDSMYDGCVESSNRVFSARKDERIK